MSRMYDRRSAVNTMRLCQQPRIGLSGLTETNPMAAFLPLRGVVPLYPTSLCGRAGWKAHHPSAG